MRKVGDRVGAIQSADEEEVFFMATEYIKEKKYHPKGK